MINLFVLFGTIFLLVVNYGKATVVRQNVSALKWTYASKELLRTHLYRDEQCMIAGLASNLTDVNPYAAQYTDLVLDHSRCEQPSKESGWATLVHSREAVGCSLAGVYYRCGVKKPARFQYSKNECGSTYTDRFSFFTGHFENLVPGREGPGVSHVTSLYNTLRKLNYSYFPILGDSISFQVHLTLIGTWQRTLTLADMSPMKMYKGNYVPCGLQKVSKMSHRPDECLTPDNSKCTEDGQAEYLKNFTIRYCEKHRDSSAYRSLIMIHPFGVHIWKEDVGVVLGVARGLIEAGKAALARNSTLLVLESPAQHFLYDVNDAGETISDNDNYSGVYQQHAKFHRAGVPGPCCLPTKANEEGDFRNVALLKALDSVDRDWRNYMGWIHFYHITQQVHNGHRDVEQDCTHFAYSPFLFDPVWQDIEYEVLRLQPR